MVKKTPVVLLGVLLVVAMGGVYYYFPGREYVLHFSETEIQEKLNDKLPLTRTYLLVFQVTIEHPRIDLRQDSKRVAAGLFCGLAGGIFRVGCGL